MFNSLVMSVFLYGIQVWSAAYQRKYLDRIDRFHKRAHRFRFVSKNITTLDLIKDRDSKLFKNVIRDDHILHDLLPPKLKRVLRERKHDSVFPRVRTERFKQAGVQRFLGMCQYLSKFCHNLSETVLRDLTKENSTFLWSSNHENVFNTAKHLIASATALRYYDSTLPVTLQVDASEDAIGGVLLENDQPVCFTSHRLNNTEKNYAQIEKECLTIVSFMDKWHHYLYGKHDITVLTDHQPLETVFKRPLCKAPR